MPDAAEKLAREIAFEHKEMAVALDEMLAFEQALSSPTALYQYPCSGRTKRRLESRGLIRVEDRLIDNATRLRLTAYGREVARHVAKLGEVWRAEP